ncbi:hypothetical protein [Neoroseomonas soli]|uniref:Uncharacterized protein n=1 Tax=Neoroseomonas soli TaxID=1081025 RepID=A0A9X9X1D4_9PROT|nr:hypothetical protein [Neoroseomonas soli]MBR0673213.1 hypothetical protein [Neoroseomonas soli]
MTNQTIHHRGQREALPHTISTPTKTTEARRDPIGLTPAEIRQIVLDVLG